MTSLRDRSPERLGEFALRSGSAKTLEFEGDAQQPAVSLTGDMLAYSALSARMSLWRKDLTHPDSAAVELVPSSRTQFDAQYSPDGKSIAFVSLRTGLQGVWMSKADGTDLVQLSDPVHVSGSPQWSPDGSKIAFDAHTGEHWEIFVVHVADQRLTRLVTNRTDVIRPHWSADGAWIYFNSQEPGRMGSYRCPASGGDAVLVSKGAEEINAHESADGKVVYFASGHDKSTLKQVALKGQQPGPGSPVDGLPQMQASELWTLSSSGIYFVPAEAPRSLRRFDFATKQVRPISDVPKDFGPGLSVSPNGRWILYSLVGDDSSDIILVDHFR